MHPFDYDVIVIGGGVTGCCAARYLSRYDLKTCLLEKGEDVCSGTSKANSAIVHAGYDALPGTQKAFYNVRGSAMIRELCSELDFDYEQNGSMILCFDEKDMPKLEELLERGRINGVEGMRIISGDEAREMEPNLTDEVVAALDVPTGGIVCPFNLTIAMAENACDNGVEFRFLTAVTGVKKLDGGYELTTNKGTMTAKYIVNAAGLYADDLHNMVSEKKLHITARKGDYILMDQEAGDHVSRTIFQLPGAYGKGVLVTPTVHGNLLTGPTAVDADSPELTATSAAELASIQKTAALSVKDIPFRLTITSFCGLRAHEEGDDFVIGEVEDAPGFFDAAGIESPGLSSAPAIGEALAEMIAKKSGAAVKADWKPERIGIVRPKEMTPEARAELIKNDPAYGTIVCRCEGVSEGEIVDAIRRTLGATSLDGVKRRVRQGMGRCQAGFCTPRTMEILARETGRKIEEICKNVPGSEMLVGRK